MKITLSKEDVQTIKLVEELKNLWTEGYVEEKYYPDMAEVHESLYDLVLYQIYKKNRTGYVGCCFSIDDMKDIIKKARKEKLKNETNL